jgi:hypothetical protein
MKVVGANGVGRGRKAEGAQALPPEQIITQKHLISLRFLRNLVDTTSIGISMRIVCFSDTHGAQRPHGRGHGKHRPP